MANNIECIPKNTTPLVSIITATYNSEKFIKDTYASISKQTIENWEWLITDDCSTDSTVSILKSISMSDPRVTFVVNQKNSGAAISRNVSLARCNGVFIAFIDSDDLWLPQKLEKQIEFMSQGNNFTFTGYELIDENGDSLNKKIDVKPQPSIKYKDLLRKKVTLGCSSVMLRRSAFTCIEMPLLRTGQDYALWLKLLRNGTKADLLPITLMKYRIVKNSISRNKFKKARRQWEIYRRIEGLDIFHSMIYFLHYAVRAIVR